MGFTLILIKNTKEAVHSLNQPACILPMYDPDRSQWHHSLPNKTPQHCSSHRSAAESRARNNESQNMERHTVNHELMFANNEQPQVFQMIQ